MYLKAKQTELQFLTVSIGFLFCFVLGDYTLKIDLTDFEKNSSFAQYQSFKVGDKKVLKILYRQCLELMLKICN
jgi:hypothetical protein